jgi:hypothetical protein
MRSDPRSRIVAPSSDGCLSAVQRRSAGIVIGRAKISGLIAALDHQFLTVGQAFCVLFHGKPSAGDCRLHSIPRAIAVPAVFEGFALWSGASR